MSIRLKVAKNTIYQIIAKFFSAGVTLISTIFITRALGAETFSEYAIVTTYVMTFFVLADFGVNAVIIRDFAQNPISAKTNLTKIYGFRIIMGLILTAFALIMLGFTPYSETIKKAILVCSPILFIQSVSKAPTVIFQSFLRYKYQAISVITGSIVGFVILVLFLHYGQAELLILSLIYLLGYVVTLIISTYFVRDYINLKGVWIDIGYWKYFLLDALPLGIGLLLNTLMIQMDRLLLSFMAAPISVGIYITAYKIFDFVLVIPTYYMNSVYPILSEYKISDTRMYTALLKKSVLVLVTIAVFLTILTLVFSRQLMTFLWGEELGRAYIPLNLLMLGSWVFFVTAPLSWVVLLENKQKYLPFIYGLALLVNLLLNLVFIPKYDYIACSIITVVTEFIVLAGLILVLSHKRFKSANLNR